MHQMTEEALSHPRAVPQHWPLTLEELKGMDTEDLLETATYADFSYLTELLWRMESTWYNSPELRPSLLGVVNTYFIYKLKAPRLTDLYTILQEIETAVEQLREHHPHAQDLITTGSAAATYLKGVLSVQHFPLMKELSELILRLEEVEGLRLEEKVGTKKLTQAYAALLLFPTTYRLEELRPVLVKLERKLEKLELAVQEECAAFAGLDNYSDHHQGLVEEKLYLGQVREEARHFSTALEVHLLLMGNESKELSS